MRLCRTRRSRNDPCPRICRIDTIGVTGHRPAASERCGDIDKPFPFDQTLEALVYVEQGHANGKNVVTTID